MQFWLLFRRSVKRSVINNQCLATRNFSKLILSKEAIRQRSKGWELDLANKIAPEVPILESVFNDQNLFNNDDDFLNESYFVSPQSAFASDPTQIRGSSSWSVSNVFSNRLMSKCPSVQRFGETATVFFWPAWHPVAQYRKSRPSLVIIKANTLNFNGNHLAKDTKSHHNNKSVSPLDYARWRQATSRRFKKALWQTITKLKSSDVDAPYNLQKLRLPEVDGLYMISVRRVPSVQEAHDIMYKAVQEVAKSSPKFSHSYPSAFNVTALNQLHLVNHIKPPVPHLFKSQWITLNTQSSHPN